MCYMIWLTVRLSSRQLASLDFICVSFRVKQQAKYAPVHTVQLLLLLLISLILLLLLYYCSGGGDGGGSSSSS